MPGERSVGKSRRRRLPYGDAHERIVEAAERLFANKGYDAVSFRDLADAAGVSLSAINYHFGSKLMLFSEVFSRRARLMTDRRLELLEAAIRYGGHPLPLESILDAFLRPAFEVTQGDRNDLFNRLRARVSMEQGAMTRKIVSEAFDKNDFRFIKELSATLSHLTEEDLHWRFHFLVGAMIYTMSDSGQLEGLSGGKCSPADTAYALETMTKTFAAVFQAPSIEPRLRQAATLVAGELSDRAAASIGDQERRAAHAR